MIKKKIKMMTNKRNKNMDNKERVALKKKRSIEKGNDQNRKKVK